LFFSTRHGRRGRCRLLHLRTQNRRVHQQRRKHQQNYADPAHRIFTFHSANPRLWREKKNHSSIRETVLLLELLPRRVPQRGSSPPPEEAHGVCASFPPSH